MLLQQFGFEFLALFSEFAELFVDIWNVKTLDALIGFCDFFISSSILLKSSVDNE